MRYGARMSPDYEDPPADPFPFQSVLIATNFITMVLGILAVLTCLHLQTERDAAFHALALVLDQSERVEQQASECASFNDGILLKWREPQPVPTLREAPVFVQIDLNSMTATAP